MTPCRAYFRPDGSLLIAAGEQTVEFHLSRAQAAELAAVLLRYAHPREQAALLTSFDHDDRVRNH